MIKNLIFDLGGVLVSLDRERCLGNFAKNLGFGNFGDYLNAYAQKGFFAEFENGNIDAAQFREIVKGYCRKENVQDEEIDSALNSFLTLVEPYKVELLLKLKEKYNMRIEEIDKNFSFESSITREDIAWHDVRKPPFKI